MGEGPDSSSGAVSGEFLAYIVGPNHFQNVLLAAYIATQQPWESHVVDGLAALPCRDGESPRRQTAVLYDCFGLSGNYLSELLSTGLDQLPQDCALVLFNLDRRAEIEKSAMELGVLGFFYQEDSVETLLKGLSAIIGGQFWVSRQKMTEVILEQGFALRRRQGAGRGIAQHGLSRREAEILSLLTLGASNKLISEKLFISPHTVRTHLNHIFRKIQVTSRLKATVWATDNLFPRRHS